MAKKTVKYPYHDKKDMHVSFDKSLTSDMSLTSIQAVSSVYQNRKWEKARTHMILESTSYHKDSYDPKPE
jgi:hypothetical protein